MIRSTRGMRRYGSLGLGASVLLIAAAPLAGPGILELLRGYGVLLALSAAYLLAGEWLLTLARSRRGAARTPGAVLVQH